VNDGQDVEPSAVATNELCRAQTDAGANRIDLPLRVWGLDRI
jgi:hypothetical protein